VNHAELLAKITALCDELGLLWHHCPDSRKCWGQRGFPDLLIAGPGGLIIAELKTRYDDTTAYQDLWGWTLTRAWNAMGAAAHPSGWIVWRESDLADGTIRNALEEICA
jgi:hypothetical protein